MFFGGSAIWTSIAVGAILVVAIAVAGSLTVLPATLGWLGDRVEKGRIPFSRGGARGGDSRVWGGILDRVLRRPALSAALAGGLLARPRRSRALDEDGRVRRRRSPAVARDHADLRPHPGGVPGRAAARGRRDRGARTSRLPPCGTASRDSARRRIATGLMAEPDHGPVERERARVTLVSVPLAGSGTDEESFRALARSATRSSRAPSGRFPASRRRSAARPRCRRTSTP